MLFLLTRRSWVCSMLGALIILIMFAGITLVVRLWTEAQSRFLLLKVWKHVDTDDSGTLDDHEIMHLLKVWPNPASGHKIIPSSLVWNLLYDSKRI